MRTPACMVPALLLIAGCANDGGSIASSGPDPDPVEHEWLSERAGETGLDVVHVNGASGRSFQPRNPAG